MIATVVPMSAGGPSERQEAHVEAHDGVVWLELGRPGGIPAGAPMTTDEAIALSRELADAAHQAGAR